MNDKTQEALRLAEEVLVEYRDTQMIKAPRKTLEVIREALVESVDMTEQCVDETPECGHEPVGISKTETTSEPVAWIHPRDLEILLKLKENYQSDTICGYQMGKDAADPKDRGVPLYAAPVKHVAVVDEVATRLDGTPIFNAIGNVEVGQKLYAAPVEPVQEPVAWRFELKAGEYAFCSQKHAEANKFMLTPENHTIPLYAAPVRTKDLTDEEVKAIWLKVIDPDGGNEVMALARAVIAADREKNK